VPRGSSSDVAAAAAAAPAPSAGEAPLLAVRELEVSYAGSVRALHGVSVAVPEGAVAAVLGSNGAGKSTLLRAVSGTLAYARGAIVAGSIEYAGGRLDGADPAAIVRAGLVQVPEGRQVFADLTVAENLRAGGLATPRSARRAARERVYDLFPVLRERGGQRAGLLSGGEQQLLAIGRALMAAPRLLLLDEPSLGLAPLMVERIGAVIAEINRQGTTVVLVEQNAALALELADIAYVLEVGRVALSGPAAELAATDQVRDRYLGTGAGPDRGPGTAGTGPVGIADGPAAERTGAGRGRVAGAATMPAARSAPAAEPAIEPAGRLPELVVAGIGVRFGGVAALADVSFTVAPGTVHALIGPNGAGKSSCLNVLTGVYPAAAGSARYGGHELTALRPHRIARLGVARTFQNLALSPTGTVADALLLGRHRLTRAGFVAAGLRTPRARREQAEQDQHVRAVADLLELTDVLHRPVDALPYGDRKRVELGRALCAEPTLLLLDEPVAGMTAAEAARLAGALARVRAEVAVTILLVDHDMAFVLGIADRVTVLDFGRRIAAGSPAQVRADPAVVRAYLGTPAAGRTP
jgi:ABC-type branched-subunit amino acid transport system ATPase component